MRSSYLLVSLLAKVLVASCQFTPVLDSSTETFVNQVLGHWESPTGVSIAVVRPDSQGAWYVETGGYGHATLDGSKTMTANTRLGIGSNSKLFTAAAAGLLTKDSRISPPLTWSSKMRTLLPGWGLEDEFANQEATVQDLLSHRTGVPMHQAAIRRSDTNADIIRKVKNHRPSASFRDIWQYNNHMYKIVAMLAPTLLPSGTSHARYVKENIFDKLGLNTTTYSFVVANSTGELADGITREILPGPGLLNFTFRAIPYWIPDSDEDGNNQAGDGGIVSTAADVAVWIQALLLKGENPKTNQSVIPPDVVQRLATGISVESGASQFPELSPLVYGAGQERGSYRGQEFIEHGGSVPGYNTVISRYSNANYGIAVLSNDDQLGGILVKIVQYYLADRIFGLEQIDWDARFQSLVLAEVNSGPGPTPRPANATFPYGNIEKLEGVYDNAGYGKTELCYISPTFNFSSLPRKGSSKSCNVLRASIPTILPGVNQPNVPAFLASWNATTFSHVILRHFDGGLFNVSTLASYPTGDPSNSYWVQDSGGVGQAEVDKGLTGFGLTGIWGSAGGVSEPSGKILKERAEVWFARF